MKYNRHFSTRNTPQKEPIPGKAQVENSEGGYVFAVNDKVRLDRFLILGSEGGSYYANEHTLTVENANSVLSLIGEDGQYVVNRAVEISECGRAPRNDPALFVLAMCAGVGDLETRRSALEALPRVARTGTHLFQFVDFVQSFRGWGRGLREGVANWYNGKAASKLAYQMIKYRQRGGWTHHDVLHKCHARPKDDEHQALYMWAKDGSTGAYSPNIVAGFVMAQNATTVEELIGAVVDFNLPWEAIPTTFHNEPAVWEALVQHMPLTATMRNLGRMTNLGVLASMSSATNIVLERFGNVEIVHKSRVHPLNVLVALRTYQQGHGVKGKLTWSPVGQIVDALDDMYYVAFDNVEPTGKRLMLALDVSASMAHSINNMPLSCREASAALAMVTARTEKNYMVTIFSSAGRNFLRSTVRGYGRGPSGMGTIDVSPRQRLDDVVRRVNNLPFGGTDCSLPMQYATVNKLDIDTFVVYTDSETWAGTIHPSQALDEYRRKFNPQAKLVVVGMVSNGFSIADPDDAGMMDVVGFDTATPNIISDFIRD